MSSFAIWKAYLLKAQKSHYFAVADPQWVPWANCTSHLLIMLPRCLLWSQLTCDRCRLSQHISREGWETKQKFTNGKLIFKNSKKNSLAKSPLLPRFWQCFHDLILYLRIFKIKFTVGKLLFGFPAFSGDVTMIEMKWWENIPGNAGNSYFHYIGMTEADIPGFVQVLITKWYSWQ